MSDLQLMNDYFEILEKCQDPDEAFKDSPGEKSFATAWLRKLCNDIYRRNEEKQTRNLYLLQLSRCIKNGELNQLFMSLPPKGKLKPLESPFKINIDPKLIVGEMEIAAQESIPHSSPRNYQTHMSTKLFDNNQGACAYLAVSLGDPKDGPIWMEMGNKGSSFQTNNIKEENILEDCDSYDDDNEEVNLEFLELCLHHTANEIAGLAEPGQCPLLEEQLQLYENFIKNYDIGVDACHLSKSEFRTFLLMNFQTDLLHALQRFK
ncbi:uncharacterized protein LOC129909176 [Episyrphus balteatus]|uniref:uncharacterized protein LOC129909176 n=1 Tax=Episyrphus balteatus TaxID=286459 RepID=UPI0024865299|nr:uncharacterized protein LOC129909176 [Episyrphus balteatus]